MQDARSEPGAFLSYTRLMMSTSPARSASLETAYKPRFVPRVDQFFTSFRIESLSSGVRTGLSESLMQSRAPQH